VANAPISLTNDPLTTTDTVIRFTWSDGSSNGGSSIIDYTVYYDQGTSTFVQLEAGVISQFYLTSVTLSAGTTYVFKVQSRNSVGFSSDSADLSVLAAKLPDAPINLVNDPATTTTYQVGLTWSDGAYNGGSPVIDYQVSFTEESSNTFAIFAIGIATQSTTVTGLTPGVSYKFIVESRNIVDLSLPSDSVTILAAQIPDVPTILANVVDITDGDSIGLTWSAPVFDGGSSIIDYRVWSDDASGGVTFTILEETVIPTEYVA
jgi:hypothetical protein